MLLTGFCLACSGTSALGKDVIARPGAPLHGHDSKCQRTAGAEQVYKDIRASSIPEAPVGPAAV